MNVIHRKAPARLFLHFTLSPSRCKVLSGVRFMYCAWERKKEVKKEKSKTSKEENVGAKGLTQNFSNCDESLLSSSVWNMTK